MITLRCTQKLLSRIAGPVDPAPEASTTRLGDWYANILFSKPQLVLCMNERTLLPVVVRAKDLPSLPERLAEGLHAVLTALGVPAALADQECAEMRELRLAPTASKKVLGSLNDMMYHLEAGLQQDPEKSLLQRSLHLGRIPFKATGFKFPTELAQEAFGVAVARPTRQRHTAGQPRGFPESDWQAFRRLRPLVLERFCSHILWEIDRIATAIDASAHERYLDIFDLIRERDRDLAGAFNDPRRSVALIQLGLLCALGLVTDDELRAFTSGTQKSVRMMMPPDDS